MHTWEWHRQTCLKETLQRPQRWMRDEVKLEAVKHIKLIAQNGLAVLTHQAAELISANVGFLNLHDTLATFDQKSQAV